MTRPMSIILLLLIAGLAPCARSALSTCGMAGDKCSMPRDCCEAHECVEGDWAVSSDYSCQRVGERPSEHEYKERLRKFYAAHNEAKLSGGDLALVATLEKWKGREERLFHVLHQKYSRDEL